MCFPLPAQEKITLAVAANFLKPMQEIQQIYQQTCNCRIVFSIASSGVLTAQIKNGAPYDLFLSADIKYPESLYSQGFTLNKPLVFIYGQMAFWSRQNPDSKNIETLLNDPDLDILALAQPELAPYGRNAENWLKQQGLYEILQSKLVYGENIGKVNQLIYSGSVDAAFSANSAMYSPELKDLGYWQLVSDKMEDAIPHGMVILNYGAGKKSTKAFYQFLFGPEATEVFKKYGYLKLDIP